MRILNLKLGTKLGVGFGWVIIQIVILGILGAIKMDQILDTMTEISKTRIPQMHVVYSIYEDYLMIDRSLHALPFAQNNETKKRLENDYKNHVDSLLNVMTILEKKLITTKEKDMFVKLKEPLDLIMARSDHAFKLVRDGHNNEVADIIKTQIEPEQSKLLVNLNAFTKYIRELSEAAGESTIETNKTNRTIMSSIAFSAIIVGGLIAFFITRSITKQLNQVINGLIQSSLSVASCSSEVASASRSLAEGSSEQAAAIEEISASLEEMSTMTRQNADHATHADNLMKDKKKIAKTVQDSMENLTKSMTEICTSSEETSKIVKTIDEIAFQTNLLALNAAVEAARAGEAGAGFAVVADEVRNLAIRAADATKSTSGLIENIVQKIREGADLVSKTNEAFTAIASSATREGVIVGEIAAASQEQAQGIDQISKAIAAMDKVTQQTAASAEESASAAAEMNALSEQMKDITVSLVNIIGRNSDHAERFDGVTQQAGKMMGRSDVSVTESLEHSRRLYL